MTNHQPLDPETDEASQVTIPATRSECANPVEAALWRALRKARRERDEARMELCERDAAERTKSAWSNGLSMRYIWQDIARERGWDCFREEP